MEIYWYVHPFPAHYSQSYISSVILLGVRKGAQRADSVYLGGGVLLSESKNVASWFLPALSGWPRVQYGSVVMVSSIFEMSCHLLQQQHPDFGSAYLMASSNTLFKFLCVKAEHSKYLTALISFATESACS